MAQKIIVNANNQILLDNNKGNLVDMPEIPVIFTGTFNLENSMKIEGITKQPKKIYLQPLKYEDQLAYDGATQFQRIVSASKETADNMGATFTSGTDNAFNIVCFYPLNNSYMKAWYRQSETYNEEIPVNYGAVGTYYLYATYDQNTNAITFTKVGNYIVATSGAWHYTIIC